MSDWTTSDLKERSIAANEYIDYAKIPVGDDTYEVPYGLLNGSQILEVQAKIDMSSVSEAGDEIDMDDDVEEAEETVRELQSKDDDLTESEEEQLREAQSTLMQNRGSIIDALGAETLKAFRDAGRAAIRPDSEDIENVITSPIEAKQRFDDIDGAPTPSDSGEFTRDQAQKALRLEMLEILDPNPFMIYFTVGQEVWEQSQSAGKLVGTSEDDS